MILDQRDHQHGGGSGGGGDHARTPARDGGDHGDGEGGVKADLGIDARDDGKGNGFGDEREGHYEAREQIAPDIAEPLVAVGAE